MAKLEPSFFDQLLATPPNHIGGSSQPKLYKRIQRLLPRIRLAEKIVFDKAASERVGEVLRDIPDLVAEQVEFARPPFDVTWIEYEAETIWELVSSAERVNDPARLNDRTRDRKVGLLIDHNRVNVFTHTFDGEIGLLPIQYHLHTEWPLEDQLKFAELFEVSRTTVDLWMWGAAANSMLGNPGHRDHLRALRATNAVEVLDNVYDGKSREELDLIFQSTAGDFKNVAALLLMLNQPSLTKYVQVPRRRGWIGNKHGPFMAYHSITVALSAKAQIKLVSESGKDPVMRRGGKVRGHYCHNKTARDYARIAGCVHEWLPTDAEWTPAPSMPLDEREHWQCRVCEGRRWWRDEHTRGGDRGFVHHPSYIVKA